MVTASTKVMATKLRRNVFVSPASVHADQHAGGLDDCVSRLALFQFERFDGVACHGRGDFHAGCHFQRNDRTNRTLFNGFDDAFENIPGGDLHDFVMNCLVNFLGIVDQPLGENPGWFDNLKPIALGP